MARYYFHLADRYESIPDEVGLEVTDLAEARAETLKAIAELQHESPSTARDWEGWRLEVADASGAIVFTISLDEPLR